MTVVDKLLTFLDALLLLRRTLSLTKNIASTFEEIDKSDYTNLRKARDT